MYKKKKKKKREMKKEKKKNMCASEPNLSPFVKRVFIFLRELANIPPASLDERTDISNSL